MVKLRQKTVGTEVIMTFNIGPLTESNHDAVVLWHIVEQFVYQGTPTATNVCQMFVFLETFVPAFD